jgi:hypothetical protein
MNTRKTLSLSAIFSLSFGLLMSFASANFLAGEYLILPMESWSGRQGIENGSMLEPR